MLQTEIAVDETAHNIRALEKNRRQVLVADDNEAIQEILSRMLSSLGCEVTLAGNGIEAGTLFVTGSYDLVITDIQMPLMNGWDLCRLVKERSPKTPIIVVTGLNEEKHLVMTHTRCVDAIILKPFNRKDIEKTVMRLLNGTTSAVKQESTDTEGSREPKGPIRDTHDSL